jgi:HJR/Mrr/RecB family endonuclease
MSAVRQAPFSDELNSLNIRIQLLEAQARGIQAELSATKRDLSKSRSARAYRSLQIRLRRPKLKYSLWPAGLLVVGALLPCLSAFTLLSITGAERGTVFGYSVASLAASAAALSILLFVPNDNEMIRKYHAAGKEIETYSNRLATTAITLQSVEKPLLQFRARRNEIERSVQYKREQLLRFNWKAMRGDEWEAYLADVFVLLGAKVQRTGRSGDQGVDLIVEINGRRYAIQTKGYVNSVGNAAVQQAVAGRAFHMCNCCAVITNSRFTQGAIDLAACNNCLLVGEDDIHSLVLGKLPF